MIAKFVADGLSGAVPQQEVTEAEHRVHAEIAFPPCVFCLPPTGARWAPPSAPPQPFPSRTRPQAAYLRKLHVRSSEPRIPGADINGEPRGHGTDRLRYGHFRLAPPA